jgi:hypothetical protein
VSQLVQYSEWLIPVPVLIAMAWVRFNSPPTNRSGTTFVLFSVGLMLYGLLIGVLWLLVIIGLTQGSLGLHNLHGEFAQHAPLVAALLMVAATHVSWIKRMDDAARAFCITFAAIPREADRLALELAQTAVFQPKTERLRAPRQESHHRERRDAGAQFRAGRIARGPVHADGGALLAVHRT